MLSFRSDDAILLLAVGLNIISNEPISYALPEAT